MIEMYYKEYTEKYHKMKMALKRYMEAKEDFYSLSGIAYDKVNVMGGKAQEFSDTMARIEKLYNDYVVKKEEYETEKEKCINDIGIIDNPVLQAILEYKYLDFKDDVHIAEALKKYNGLDYSMSYVYKLITKAKNKLEKALKDSKVL